LVKQHETHSSTPRGPAVAEVFNEKLPPPAEPNPTNPDIIFEKNPCPSPASHPTSAVRQSTTLLPTARFLENDSDSTLATHGLPTTTTQAKEGLDFLNHHPTPYPPATPLSPVTGLITPVSTEGEVGLDCTTTLTSIHTYTATTPGNENGPREVASNATLRHSDFNYMSYFLPSATGVDEPTAYDSVNGRGYVHVAGQGDIDVDRKSVSQRSQRSQTTTATWATAYENRKSWATDADTSI